jgi:hypothetical protein
MRLFVSSSLNVEARRDYVSSSTLIWVLKPQVPDAMLCRNAGVVEIAEGNFLNPRSPL